MKVTAIGYLARKLEDCAKKYRPDRLNEFHRRMGDIFEAIAFHIHYGSLARVEFAIKLKMDFPSWDKADSHELHVRAAVLEDICNLMRLAGHCKRSDTSVLVSVLRALKFVLEDDESNLLERFETALQYSEERKAA